MNKHALIDLYIAFQNYSGRGRSLLAWVTSPLSYLGLAGFIAYPEWLQQNLILVGLGSIAWLIVPFVLGWWWDVKRYYHREAEWSNQRNPMVHEIRRAIKSPRAKTRKGVGR